MFEWVMNVSNNFGSGPANSLVEVSDTYADNCSEDVSGTTDGLRMFTSDQGTITQIYSLPTALG